MKKILKLIKHFVFLLVLSLILLSSSNVKVDASDNLDNLTSIIGTNYVKPSFLSNIVINDSCVKNYISEFEKFLKRSGVSNIEFYTYKEEGNSKDDYCLTLLFKDTKEYQYGAFINNEPKTVTDAERELPPKPLEFSFSKFYEGSTSSGYDGSLSSGISAGLGSGGFGSHTNYDYESITTTILEHETEFNISIPIVINDNEYNDLDNKCKSLYSYVSQTGNYALDEGLYNVYWSSSVIYYYGLKLKLSKTYTLTKKYPNKPNNYQYKKSTLSTYLFTLNHVNDDIEYCNGNYIVDTSTNYKDVKYSYEYGLPYFCIKKFA